MTGQAPKAPPVLLPRRPLLPGLYHAVRLDDDRVQVANAGRCVVLSGPDFAARALPLLSALDGSSTLDELKAIFGALVEPLLAGLLGRGLLTDGVAPGDPANDSRQDAALAVPGAPSPAEAAERLAHATVVVAGCGPVGATVADLLAKAGLGHLVLVDDQSCSKVPRSPVLTAEAEGRPRSRVVQELCESASAGIDVEVAVAAAGLPVPEGLLDGADLVVVETGYGTRGFSLDSDACLAAGLTYLPYGQDALEAIVGPLVMPGGAPCHHCAHYRRLSHMVHLAQYMVYEAHRTVFAPGPDAFLAAHCSIVAGVVATETLRGLLAPEPPPRAALVVDLAEPSVIREDVLAVPGCAWCLRAPQDPGGECG